MSIQLPTPIRPVPPYPLPQDVSQAGASAQRVTVTVAGAVKLIARGPGWLLGILYLPGAAAGTVYALDKNEEQADASKRISAVKAAAAGFDGWVQGPAVKFFDGLAIQLPATDDECFVYYAKAG